MSDYKIRGWPPTAEFVVDSVTRIEKLEARIKALEAALRILLELHNTKHQTHNDVLIVEHIRAALAPEQDK